MHLPRRHRRQLLLPPGLLALAGLLCLGCALLGGHPEQLKRRSVMQLTMPPRPDSDFLWGKMQYGGPHLRYSQLPYFRQWRTVEFGGGGLLDTLATRQLKAEINDLAAGWQTRPLHDGLRVRFGSRARYASLVLVLDLMNRYGVKKYFLDVYHPRTGSTFYAFDGGIQRRYWRDSWFRPLALVAETKAETEALAPVSLPLWVRMSSAENWAPDVSQLAESWELLQAPEWRGPALLLALLGVLTVWRGRPGRA
ncbi:hypothetical protein [Hymenobacter ruricola]|uniref:DUF4136 domain-containing protein n=1 Tax=Hymenobacter ruricola TaxID=2791023 RepID=A0ABS0IAP9_9BACT|nr:hypothetical protein [Hymenobacter ruricola]MBF9224058.1 hypothetical protein [Hymenobacter ruricola]